MLLVIYVLELAYFNPRIHIYDVEHVTFLNYMGIYFVTGHISCPLAYLAYLAYMRIYALSQPYT